MQINANHVLHFEDKKFVIFLVIYLFESVALSASNKFLIIWRNKPIIPIRAKNTHNICIKKYILPNGRGLRKTRR